MSRSSSSSSRGRFFRPALEKLEDRIVPSDLGDLLNNPDVQKLLEPAKQYLTGLVANANTNAVTNVAAGEFWILQENFAVGAFNKAPNLSNLSQLENDTVQLVNAAILADIYVEELSGFLKEGESVGAVSGLTASALEAALSGLQAEVNRLMQAAHTALGNFFQAAATLFGGGQATLPTIPAAPAPPPATSTGGGYGVTYSDAPGAASASGPNVTESATITASAGNDAPITASITYSANDGTSGGPVTKTIAPGATQTVSLTVSTCPSGVVGTWTVTIDGQVNHTNTTTFTP